MKELDLHGCLHHEVESKVLNFLFLNARYLPVKIITGNSDKMKSIVVPLLEKYKFEYNIPPHNSGEVIVLFDKEFKL